MATYLDELFSLDGRVAIVTGGNSGIGRACAESLAEAGAAVVIVGRKPETLDETQRAIRERGGRCASVVADLQERDAVAAAAEQCVQHFGEPDILINSAGINPRPHMTDLSQETWDEVMAVNLTSGFLLGQRFGPVMASNGFGRIVNVGSQQSFRAFGNSGAYGASKAAIVGLTRSQAEAWGHSGVTANVIIPGSVPTAMNQDVYSDPVRVEAMKSRTMVGRNGTVDDFRGIVVYLASGASDFVTGQAICVDGGFSAT